MCVHHSAPPGFDFSIYMAGLHPMSLNSMYDMVFNAILCNKHNTDMYPTDDYMVV